ncbi:hypothetical protein [Halomonas salipaludis]|uniref:hypothetical protein n=1 Tax=Halomonas salipaludis TaxID=2032625 RepID=UPI001140A833|nr:hypothetical protein [Halomonas salipaludis]
MSKSFSINTFQDRDEILRLDGVSDDLGVDQKNFSSLVGDYHFPNDIVPLKCCCFKESGRLCGQDHRHGYVVELSNGKKSLLGSSCILKFESEGEIRKSVRRYNNEKEFLERINYINHSFYGRDKDLRELKQKKENIEDVQRYYNDIKKSVPPSVMRKLEQLAKQGAGNVVIELVLINEGENKETGEIEREKRVISHTVGQLSGLGIFHGELWGELLNSINEKISLLEGLEYTNHDASFRTVSLLYRKLSEIEQLKPQADSVCAEKFLFEMCDKLPLCYLVPSHDERIKMVRMWLLEKYGKPINSTAAKDKLEELDEGYKELYDARELRIP